MGCTDDWGISPAKERECNLLEKRGYIEGDYEYGGQCLRCGVSLGLNRDPMDLHDQFHVRVDGEFEKKNGYGIFSKYFKSESK